MSDNNNLPITIVNYKEFDFNNLAFGVPTKSRSGSYVSNGLYQGTDLYIQTPRLKCTSLINTDNRSAIDLEFDKSHGMFYDFITSIDDYSIIQIQKNSKSWFSKEFPLDVVEEYYKTPVKMGRKNKAPSLKIKVPMTKGEPNVTVYDNKNNIIDFDRIKENTKVLIVLRFNGLKFLKQQVICEWIPIQIKSFQSFAPKKNVYLIRDNLLTDDESDHSNKNKNTNTNKIIVEKIDSTVPINSLEIGSEQSNKLEVVLEENNDPHNLEHTSKSKSTSSEDNEESLENNLRETGISDLSLTQLENNILTDTIEPESTTSDGEFNSTTSFSEIEQEPVETEPTVVEEPVETEPTVVEEPVETEPTVVEEPVETEPEVVEQETEVVEEPVEQETEVVEPEPVVEETEVVEPEPVVEETEVVEPEPEVVEQEPEVVEEPVETEVVEQEPDLSNLNADNSDDLSNIIEIKKTLERNEAELNNIETELRNDISNCQEELYSEYDLGLSDDELSEVDILTIGDPEKNVHLDKSSLSNTDSEKIILKSQLEEKDRQVRELQENLKQILQKINN
jgi:hypothetical protein